jgi:hypothetical protein
LTTFVTNDLDAILIAYRSDAKAARILGVNPAQLTRWRKGQRPDAPNQTRVRELANAIRQLGTVIPSEAIADWMSAPEVHSGLKPVDLLRAGRYQELASLVWETLQGDIWS